MGISLKLLFLQGARRDLSNQSYSSFPQHILQLDTPLAKPESYFIDSCDTPHFFEHTPPHRHSWVHARQVAVICGPSILEFVSMNL